MVLIISGDDINKLKEVEALARSLGLKVETDYSKDESKLDDSIKP